MNCSAFETYHDGTGVVNVAAVPIQQSYHFKRSIVAKDKSDGLCISVHNLPVRLQSLISIRFTGSRLEWSAVRLNVGDVINQIPFSGETGRQYFTLAEHSSCLQKEIPGDANAISGDFLPDHQPNRRNDENYCGPVATPAREHLGHQKASFIARCSLGRFPHRSGRMGRYPNISIPGACQLRVCFPRRRSHKILRLSDHFGNGDKLSLVVRHCTKSIL